MNVNKYLQKFSESIKGIPEREKSDLMEEISSHLTEGENDPALFSDGNRLSREMGDPVELGRQMKRVHRSMAWAEYLLIVLPEFLVSPAMGLIMLLLYQGNPSYTPAMNHFSVRLVIWIYIILTSLGYWIYRRHGQPTAYLILLTIVWGMIIRLYILEHYSTQAAELQSISNQTGAGAFWFIVLVATTTMIGMVLRKVKDPLWITIVVIAFMDVLEGLLTAGIIYSGGFTEGYPYENLKGWSIVSQLSVIIWPLLFLFTNRRPFRWSALLVKTIPASIINILITRILIGGSHPVLIFTRLMPVIVVLGFWVADMVTKKRNMRMVNQS